MSLEMAHKVILPPKKNYIPQFLKQRDINSYSSAVKRVATTVSYCLFNTTMYFLFLLLFTKGAP
jgi:hypothetical protein